MGTQCPCCMCCEERICNVVDSAEGARLGGSCLRHPDQLLPAVDVLRRQSFHSLRGDGAKIRPLCATGC
eukprot:13877887-Heterocapsa_arctica.AAC.2